MLPIKDTEPNEKFPVATITIIALNIMVLLSR